MKSPVKTKRFRAIMDNGKKFDFGYEGAFTYLDGADDKVRAAYRKRHYANKTEKELIDNLVPSASLLSYYVIWGETRDAKKNVELLNEMWRKKYAMS
jgi:hypothetical protein